MIVESLQEAERVLNERWNAKTPKERIELSDRYHKIRQMRAAWKRELKPIFDKLEGKQPCA